MKISLCMIVKNEEKYIKMCLENAMKLADEAIIVDTGSTDKTKKIIGEFNNSNIKLIDYKWEDDFSKARNISIEAAKGDWILMLDADEKLLCNVDKVRNILEKAKSESYRIPLYNILNTSNVVYSSVYLKLFKNNRGYKYFGRIHEQLNVKDDQINGNGIDSSIAQIIHYGYLGNVIKDREKAKRNLKILRKQLKDNPNDPFVRYNIGASYEVAGNYKKALEYFFKANDILKRGDPTGLTLYEIDMAKRICECLINLKKYDDCIMLASNLLTDNKYKGYVDLQYIKSWCYFFTKEIQKSCRKF
ncbi:glycosyltransferase family 2 protein [Clostridium sp. DMHC 10]|uniref:glycosyltransferase family 2 protein n=1 Tax=Clostridium sp. DMHC 10 TaxID=747377 RepID=UPI00069E4D41|nr:glycosyltransferase family 2 protein [Clostridium sp. DMHC 10]